MWCFIKTGKIISTIYAFFCILECDPIEEFTCGNGECIAIVLKCDGENDCNDGDDEIQCSNSDLLVY